MQLDKIKKFDKIAKLDAIKRNKEIYSLFLAGPYIDIEKPIEHEHNSANNGKILRYKLYKHFESAGHHVYMGEDHRLRSIGDAHYGEHNNAVAYERHIIKDDIDALIVLPFGPGVFCELGDWSTTTDICPKMFIVVDKEHEGIPNYINDGVVKSAKTLHSDVEYIDYKSFDDVLKACNRFIDKMASLKRLSKNYDR